MDISALYKCFTECGKVTTDSRNCPEGSMFIALKGETFNGNAYALQALEKGCQYAVVDEKEYAADGHPRILLVDDCLKHCRNWLIITGIKWVPESSASREPMGRLLPRN